MSGPRANGFTLIELLVSIAILALMATMVAGGVVSAGVLARSAARDRAAGAEVAAAQAIIRQRIALFQPVGTIGGSPPIIESRGTEQTYAFFSLPADAGRDGGRRKFRLMLTPRGELAFFHASELSSTVDLRGRALTGWQAQTVLRDVASLSISYFGASRSDPERKWRTFWYDQQRPPEVLRIRVTFAGDDPRIWPDLYVRPAADIDLSCDPEAPAALCGKGGPA